MRITSVDLLRLKTEGAGPVRPIICRINTDEGIYGLGEAGVAIVSGATAAYELLKDYATRIIGMNPLHHEVIWEKLYKDTFWAQGNGAIIMAAVSAIDTALWDIRGKHYDAPVYELLGGKQRSKLRTYASQLQFGWGIPAYNRDGGLQKYEDACKAALDEGYTAVKVNFFEQRKHGPNVNYLETTGFLSSEIMNTAEERIARLRELMGPDGDILLENHAMTDAVSSIQFAHMAEKFRPMFLEEPATPLNSKVFEKIAANTSIPLATGERTFTRWGFRPLIESGAISVAQPDIGNCGGISEVKKICDMADTYDVKVQIHVCGGPIATAAALQVEATIPNFTIHEEHNANLKNIFIQAGKYYYKPENGYYTVPDLPGIGQEMTDEFLATCRKVVIGG